jgi:hypothetical protein
MRISLIRALPVLLVCSSACHTGGPSAYDTQHALGTYQGAFGKGIATVVLNYINGDIVSGYALSKGTRRNLNGRLTAGGASVDLELKEPGDDPHDGIFSLKLDTALQSITGTWTPLHGDKDTPKPLTLKRASNTTSHEDAVTDGPWEVGEDSLVSFTDAGYCEYNFYKHSADSTSQLNTVKGSYIRTGDILIIDWEKNPYTPAQQMKLKIIKDVPEGMEAGDSLRMLKGNGWSLVQNMAG